MADTTNLKPIGEKQWLITIEGVEGTWETMTQPSVARESISYTDPTQGRTRQHLTFQSNEDITLTRLCDVDKDAAVVAWCQERMTGANTVTPFVITYSPVYADTAGTPYDGAPKYSLTGCYLKTYKLAKADRTSNNLAKFEVVCTFEDIAVS